MMNPLVEKSATDGLRGHPRSMGRGNSDQAGTAARRVPPLLPPQDPHDHLGPFFRRDVRLQLHEADEEAWPTLLAETVLTNYHITEVAKRLGVPLSDADLVDLRRRAAQAIAKENLAEMPSIETLVEASRVAARGAAAGFLAARCGHGGQALLRRVTDGLMPDNELSEVQEGDWQALVIQKWRPLAIYRPSSIAEFLRARVAQRTTAEDTSVQAQSSASALAA
jgi:hypothetical protein